MSLNKIAGAFLICVISVVALPFNDYAPYAPYEPYMPYSPYNNYESYNYQNTQPYTYNRNKPINIVNNNNNVNSNRGPELQHQSSPDFQESVLRGAADALIPQRGSSGVLGMIPSILG